VHEAEKEGNEQCTMIISAKDINDTELLTFAS